MPEAFAEVLLRVYARDERYAPPTYTSQLARLKLVTRFKKIIQRGFRRVLADIGDAAKEAELSLSDDEGPSTPRVGPSQPSGSSSQSGQLPKRTLSRVSSLRLAPEADGETITTPWTPNSFTDVPNAAGRGRDASPARAKKRGVDERSPSPAKKKGRVVK